jgi:hypothetical protein
VTTAPAAEAGVLLAGGAVSGWLLAKTAGLPVPGLRVPEPVQAADALCAALAVSAGVLCVLALRPRAGGLRLPVWTAVVAVTAAATVASAGIADHQHPGGAGHPGGHLAAQPPHGRPPAEPVPYDPALPVDLGGTPGVTPAQQAQAEQLVSVTLARLPRWADPRVAEDAGFRTIGDGFTGHEHLINAAFLDDGVTLDPDRPESLVYDTSGGGRRLVAAMYMLAPGTPLHAVPDVGGELVQWHTHEDLCFSPEGYVQGLVDATGACPAGQVEPVRSPMVHVWVEPRACGPFAALEGVAGGRIADGQTRLCDHAHGSVS